MFEDLLLSIGFSRLFSFRPKIVKKGSTLVVSTSIPALVCSLGFGGRQVTVDANRRVLRVRNRYLWLARSTRFIPFDRIEEITYDYDDVNVMGRISWSHQASDLFLVGLRLKGGEEFSLFRFYGQGDFSNDGPLPDWMYWQDILETKLTMTNQEGESRMLVDVLSGMIGAPVGHRRP